MICSDPLSCPWRAGVRGGGHLQPETSTLSDGMVSARWRHQPRRNATSPWQPTQEPGNGKCPERCGLQQSAGKMMAQSGRKCRYLIQSGGGSGVLPVWYYNAGSQEVTTGGKWSSAFCLLMQEVKLSVDWRPPSGANQWESFFLINKCPCSYNYDWVARINVWKSNMKVHLYSVTLPTVITPRVRSWDGYWDTFS